MSKMKTATAHHAVGSTQSHTGDALKTTLERRGARAETCYCRPLIATPLPVFHEVSPVEYDPSFCGKPSPIVMGDLRLSGAVRTSTTSFVSFGTCGEPRLVLKHRFLMFHCHHVLFCARAPSCKNDRAAPARSWSLFVPW